MKRVNIALLSDDNVVEQPAIAGDVDALLEALDCQAGEDEAELTQVRAEQNEVHAVIEDAVDTLGVLQGVQGAVDSAQTPIADEGSATALISAIEGLLHTSGLKITTKTSTDTHERVRIVATEGVVETIRSIYQAIVALIKRVLDWFKRAIVALNASVQKFRARLQSLKGAQKDLSKKREELDKQGAPVQEIEKAAQKPEVKAEDIAQVLKDPEVIKSGEAQAAVTKLVEVLPLSQYRHLRLNNKALSGDELVQAYKALVVKFDELREQFLKAGDFQKDYDAVVETLEATIVGAAGKSDRAKAASNIGFMDIPDVKEEPLEYFSGVQLVKRVAEPVLGDHALYVIRPKKAENIDDVLKTLVRYTVDMDFVGQELGEEQSIAPLSLEQVGELLDLFTMAKLGEDEKFIKLVADKLEDLEKQISELAKKREGGEFSATMAQKLYGLVRVLDKNYSSFAMMLNSYEGMVSGQIQALCAASLSKAKAVNTLAEA